MLLDGKKIAGEILFELETSLAQMMKNLGKTRPPGLAFILVGDHKASLTYVGMKKIACDKVGIHSVVKILERNVNEDDLINIINQLNSDPLIDGILVQQPLPHGISEQKILETIDPKKDVDGFHPINIGKALLGFDDSFIACTPLGILTLLKNYTISLEGKHVLIIGRSNIVGKPLASLCVQKKPFCNATVTIAHSQTANLKSLCLEADVVVAAIGKANFVKSSMIKEGAIVIDVGINHIEENGIKKIVGDVDFEEVKNKASYITPVPGGIGPMTIAMLMSNVIKSYKNS